MHPYLSAAKQLHAYLVRQHWDERKLAGPDPGIRFNARAGRFVKSYLPFVPWNDDLVYLQAQGYWILDNWIMSDLLDDEQYAQIAEACSDHVVALQRPEGYWDYPNPEWKGRIATVEGCFAALGLLESFERLQAERFLDSAKQWYQYLVRGIGFRRQSQPDRLAVNYFAHNSRNGGGVPNNSTMVLWLLARLEQLTENDEYLEFCAPLIRWLTDVQLESGELPYQVGGIGKRHRIHFLCYQYNSFEFVDLVNYYRITADESVLPILSALARYLAKGLTPEGACRYSCLHALPDVTYYSTAIAHALRQASALGLGEFRDTIDKAYGRVFSQQRTDGGFRYYSRRNFRLLSDGRSYPRYLAMILNHLLHEAAGSKEDPCHVVADPAVAQ